MKQDKIRQLSSWLANAGDYVSGEELATLLHTTTRTIRNYVLEINSSTDGEPLILTSRKGYRWNIPEGNIQLPLYTERTMPHSPNERCSYIIRQLLYRKNIQYDTLLDQMLISSYTLDADLVSVKGLLHPFQMILHRRDNYLYLEGPQMDRRRLILNTIYNTSNISSLSMDFLETVFPAISAPEISNILEKSLFAHGLSCIGEKYYELILHVMIQMEQIHAGNVIIKQEYSLNELKSYPDYLCALDIARKLEIICGFPYPQSEKEYLAYLLIAKAEDNIPESHYISPITLDFRQSAGLLMTRLGRYLHTDFSQDEFIAWLSMYLQRMIVRQQLQLSRPSPLRSKLRSSYPTLYELTANFLFDFSKKINIPILSDEVCWLATILASYIKDSYVFESNISCTLMLPVGKTLAAQIQSTLTIRTGSLLDIKQVLLQTDEEQILPDAQLVLSLVPLKRHPHWVQISPFPKSTDFQRIYAEIDRIKMGNYLNRLQIYLKRYLKESYFLHTSELKSRSSLIHYVCDQLMKDGIVSEDYENNLIELENFESSGFDNLVAVPFLAHASVSRNYVFVVTTENHIPWMSGKINLFFFLICRNPDNADFRDLYDLLIKLFCHPKNVQTVVGSQSVTELYAALEKIQDKNN